MNPPPFGGTAAAILFESSVRFRSGFPSVRFRGPPSDVRGLRSGIRRRPPAASRPESCADGCRARIAASLVRSATGLQIALSRRGGQSPPAFRPRRASPGPRSPSTAPGRADHGPLPQGPRTRFNGEAIRIPAGPSAHAAPPASSASARGLSRNPEGAIREACAWPDPAPPISLGPPASSPASSMTARGPARLSRNSSIPGARASRPHRAKRDTQLARIPQITQLRTRDPESGRRAHARPRPVIPELPYPGCAGVPPRLARSATHRRPVFRDRASTIPDPGAASLRPVIPELPGPGSLPASHPANPAIANPAIPDPGTAPAHGPARLSRNSRTARPQSRNAAPGQRRRRRANGVFRSGAARYASQRLRRR